jgi:predicted CoA-substrate-specific enzyme activase
MNKIYLGIDCGSVSVKLALIDDNEKLRESIYLRNRGLIETIKTGLKEISKKNYKISGVGVTGSGREFVKMLLGADLTKTEVLAHTVGALYYYPKVRTLIDIGGEDSKLMIIKDGVLEDFKLNNACSAGTGSSLEAISTRIGVPIENVGYEALNSKKRLSIPNKCGVFMQSAAVTCLNTGACKTDILMAVVRSMVDNYLTMANGVKLEPPYIYQGATAKNKAIVKAFEEKLGNKVIVPEYCDVMGAIGIALMTKREGINNTYFKGFDIADRDYKTETIIAGGCENHCEMRLLYEGEKYVGALGNRCERCYPKVKN